MTAPHASRSGARVRAAVTVVAGALGAGACNIPLREVGNAPEGEIRPIESAADRARREEARHAGLDARDQANLPPLAPDDAERFGDPSSRRFHVRSCPDLQSVPAATRVSLRTAWAGIDQDFAPCPRCRPMPGRE